MINLPNSSFLSSMIEGIFFKDAKKKEILRAYSKNTAWRVNAYVFVRIGLIKKTIATIVKTNIS
jgi:hypothetical protein